ncbi:MAG: DUF3500 domain-containing protein [Pyrinomonadaceae bacterium]
MRKQETTPAAAFNKGRRRFLGEALATAGIMLVGESSGTAKRVPTPTLQADMSIATRNLLAALSPELKAKAMMPFESDQRMDWHFIPKVRKGVTFKQLEPQNRALVHALLRKGLGAHGYKKVTTIISLEDVLQEIEKGSGPVRDKELYYVTVFGEPGGKAKPWGWSFEGHHLSLNFTVSADGRIANTPLFLGSNPGEVMSGPRQGVSPLRAEESLGRELFKSLEGEQRTEALMSAEAPADILSGNSRRVNPLAPAGLAAGKLTGRQSELFMRLLSEYTGNMPAAIGTKRMRELRAAGFNQIRFAWAGGTERFQPHYYRIQGPSFLIEYDNIQNNANHIHTVWRDFTGDFGEDLLAKHHRESHRHKHHHQHA